MKITKRQLKRIIKEEKQKLLNENVPSALGMEILSIKDALFDILMGVRYHDEELAEDLELQIERLRELGYKKA
jgi:phage terminase small subunit